MNLCSPDHVSLLVHRTFNVSIPRYHIPEDTWEFEYGPAENDPEFGPQAAQTEETAAENIEDEHRESDAGGKWVHKVTGQKLGGVDGFLEFTVIGYVRSKAEFSGGVLKVGVDLQLRTKCFRCWDQFRQIHFRPNMFPKPHHRPTLRHRILICILLMMIMTLRWMMIMKLMSMIHSGIWGN